jgi:hypothetical protein
MTEERAKTPVEMVSEEELENYIFIRDDLGPLQPDYYESYTGDVRQLCATFMMNLVAAHQTAGSYWLLASKITIAMLASQIEAIKMGLRYAATTGDTKKPSSFEGIMNAEITDSKEVWDIRDAQAKIMLRVFLAIPGIKHSISQLLSQCTVLVWSTFEVLASDAFAMLLNKNPKKAALILRDEKIRKLYPLKDFFLEALEQADFDVSKTMGDILLEHRKLDSWDDICAMYNLLFPKSKKLTETLRQDKLRQLYLVRNLIVHRGGKVDNMFLQQMGIDQFKQFQGRTWHVTAKDFEDYLEVVLQAGLEILTAVEVSK